MAQYSPLHLCMPRLSTIGPGIGKIFLSCFRGRSRTFVGSTEPLDYVYQPSFSIDSRYQHYFEPTILTDKDGNLSDALYQDLSQN